MRTTVIAEDTAAPAVRHRLAAHLRRRHRRRRDRRLRHRSGRRHHDALVADLHLRHVDLGCRRAPSCRSRPGTYRIRVTGAGNTADLRLDIPSFSLTSQEVATVLLTPTTGGTLVNGAVLSQQGAYTAAATPTPGSPRRRGRERRFRLGAAPARSTIGTGVISPAVGALHHRAGGRGAERHRQRRFGRRAGDARSRRAATRRCWSTAPAAPPPPA